MSPKQKYDVFLSYSPVDMIEVETLARYLVSLDLKVWFDRWELVPGASWREVVGDALRHVSSVLLCIGKRGLAPYQLSEVEVAFKTEVSSGQTLAVIPLLLPGADTSVLPTFLRARNYVEIRDGLQEEVVPTAGLAIADRLRKAAAPRQA